MAASYRGRLVIYKGEDKTALVKLKLNNGDPLDLTGVTNLEAILKKANRTNLILSLEQVPASRAGGTYDNVIFSADTLGLVGNSIILNFDGVHDIDTIVSDWNTANPTNTVSHNGTGSSVLAAGSIQLSGGTAAYFPVDVLDEKLGILTLTMQNNETNSLRLGQDQSVSFNIDYGEHPAGTRKIAKLSKRMDVLRPTP